MKSQDIVVLLKLISLQEQEMEKGRDRLRAESIGGDPYSVRNLSALLGISKSEIGSSINRSVSSGIARRDNDLNEPRPRRKNLLDFIVYGLKFVFPASSGPMQRGLPTAFAAPMLRDVLVSAGSYNYVWPHAEGREIGQSVDPLFKSVPEAVMRDEHLYEYLALVDAIRLGNQREVGLATERLSSRLLQR